MKKGITSFLAIGLLALDVAGTYLTSASAGDTGAIAFRELSLPTARKLGKYEVQDVVTVVNSNGNLVDIRFTGPLAKQWHIRQGDRDIFCWGQVVALRDKERFPVLLYAAVQPSQEIFGAYETRLAKDSAKVTFAPKAGPAVEWPAHLLTVGPHQIVIAVAPPDTKVPEATGKSTAKEGHDPTRLKGLQCKRLDKDRILITKGFPYNKELKLQIPHVVNVLDTTLDAIRFDRVIVAESLTPKGELAAAPVNSAVGMTWNFKKAGNKFRVGDFIYTSLREGSQVAFTDDGVLLDGLDVAPAAQSPEKTNK